MIRFLLPAVLLVTSATALCAQSNSSFELNVTDPGILSPGSVVQGDFNNDGKPDIVIGGGASYSDVMLMLGNGDGTFQKGMVVGTAPNANGGITNLVAADINHDGNLDLVAIYTGQSFAVFYGNGNGTFQPAMTYPTSAYTQYGDLTVGDFNGDGLLDVAVGDQNGQIEIFRNEGGKDFTHTSTINPSASGPAYILRLEAGDVNGNGVTDLAALTIKEADVLWGNGNGTFTPVMLASYSAGADLTVARLNQDASSDIIVSYNCGTAYSAPAKTPYSPCMGIDVFYGQGNRKTFYRHALTDVGVTAGRAMAADVNADGIADLVSVTTDSNGSLAGLFVWNGNPDGSFSQTPQRFIASSQEDTSMVAGDWNRDGMIDFADGSGEVYINATNRAACSMYTINPSVTVCQPVNNTYLTSPFHLQANTYDTTAVTALQEYVDFNLVKSEDVKSFDISLTEAPGPHLLVTKAWDAKGLSFRSDRSVTVFNGTPGPVCAAALNSASICLPQGAASGSPVHVLANGYSSAVPTSVQLYVDGSLVINNDNPGTSYIDSWRTLAKGPHYLVFKMWDAVGNSYMADKSVTVQ